ncbi:nucleotidyltransferase domain-containing protein [Methanocella arvoryzae]|uniref:Polymerase beta nucleotidyltransferase domain-containing protein n=1 Tax=Methanocella arvoryzae (strain DSM 22066 / NBRC 105507 / MRE50) TaxID=351160 RepID=Q0W203_METAR|nr:nucleotidyltransferase domain-containing protein [Methanocella arvoryzae]CAJ37590.1 conserved hypothetical protein [Methanocella arvoryzae MRE50]
MTDAFDADIDKVTGRIRDEIPGIVSVYLFGSIAKGTYDENSDYDIAVIVNELPEDDIGKISNIRYSLLDQLKRPLDIVILALSDLEHPSPLLYEIYHSRKLIYGQDILTTFKNVIADMKPVTVDGATVGYYVGY